MSGTKGVHLFSNGFEHDCWDEANCCRCIKQPTCDLINRLFTDSIDHDLPNGNVTEETARRLGYTRDYLRVLGWPCAERQPGVPGEEPPPDPAAVEMRKAGAAALPGFEP